MNPLQALITRRAGRQLAHWYSLARQEGYQKRLPSLSELGYVAGFSVLVLMAKCDAHV